VTSRFDVTCRPEIQSGRPCDPFVLQVSLTITLLDKEHLSYHVFLQPRAVIENKMPVAISLKTPMPHTFSLSSSDDSSGKDVIHNLGPDGRVEVFTPGPSLAVTAKTSDMPVGGTTLGWMDGGWIDLPLVPEFQLPEPLTCIFPFAADPDPLARAGARGSEFIIAEGIDALEELLLRGTQTKQPDPELAGVKLTSVGNSVRTFFVTVCFYAVDHTGDLLFESISLPTASMTRRSSMQIMSKPFSAFASSRHLRRISLLPSSNTPIRLLQLTMDGDEGVRRSTVSKC
jgi:hypothetical protein